MYSLNLGLRMGLEVVAIAFLAYAGFEASDTMWIQVALALGAVLLFAGTWGTFVSPRAPLRLRDPSKAILEVLLFGAAAAAVGFNGLPGIAVLFGVAVSGNLVLMFLLSQRDR